MCLVLANLNVYGSHFKFVLNPASRTATQLNASYHDILPLTIALAHLSESTINNSPNLHSVSTTLFKDPKRRKSSTHPSQTAPSYSNPSPTISSS